MYNSTPLTGDTDMKPETQWCIMSNMGIHYHTNTCSKKDCIQRHIRTAYHGEPGVEAKHSSAPLNSTERKLWEQVQKSGVQAVKVVIAPYCEPQK